MNSNGQSPQSKLAAEIHIFVNEDGEIRVQANGQDQLAVINALGNAISQLTVYYRQKQVEQIQAAPPSLISRLLNN